MIDNLLIKYQTHSLLEFTFKIVKEACESVLTLHLNFHIGSDIKLLIGQLMLGLRVTKLFNHLNESFLILKSDINLA